MVDIWPKTRVARRSQLTCHGRIRYCLAPAQVRLAEQAFEPQDGVHTMPDRAYVLINVLPGQTTNVVKSLNEIKEIKTIDPCWGKPDIFAVVEVPDQDSLTSLVLTRIHAIEGVAQTDTHLVYHLHS